MTKSHLSFETVERWRNVVRVIGALCVIVGLLLAFPFIQGLLEGQGSGVSHDLGSNTFRTFAVADSGLTASGIIVAAIGVLLLLIGHFLLR